MLVQAGKLALVGQQLWRTFGSAAACQSLLPRLSQKHPQQGLAPDPWLLHSADTHELLPKRYRMVPLIAFLGHW